MIKNKKIFYGILIIGIILIAGVVLFVVAVNRTKIPVPGGPCSYDKFKGACKITSIINENVVNFTFTPADRLNLENKGWDEEDIKENQEYAGYLGLECLKNHPYPLTREDLQKCDVKENAVFNCEMGLITGGTCSPEVFNFFEIIK